MFIVSRSTGTEGDGRYDGHAGAVASEDKLAVKAVIKKGERKGTFRTWSTLMRIGTYTGDQTVNVKTVRLQPDNVCSVYLENL